MPASRARVLAADAEGGEARDLEAALVQQRAGAAQHGGLAAPGIALNADHTVAAGRDELDRLLLTGRERTVAQRLVHGPLAHGRRAPPGALAHQRNGLLLVGDGLVGGDASVPPWKAHGMEGASAFEAVYGAFGFIDRDRARPPGEGVGEQVGAREH